MNLTDEELRILGDTQYLKLKNELTRKVLSCFSDIESSLKGEIAGANCQFPPGTFTKTGKISKGEQYEGLPYFILDYPRKFTKKEVFALRLMLWWGHGFSYTLHLQGAYLKAHQESIISKIYEEKELYYCVNESPWEYHFRETNYMQIKQLSKVNLYDQISENGFIKVSDRLAIEKWNHLKSFSEITFARFLRLCS